MNRNRRSFSIESLLLQVMMGTFIKFDTGRLQYAPTEQGIRDNIWVFVQSIVYLCLPVRLTKEETLLIRVKGQGVKEQGLSPDIGLLAFSGVSSLPNICSESASMQSSQAHRMRSAVLWEM